MPRNYQVERDAIFRRWYGNNPQPLNPRPNRSPGASVIGPEDCLGIRKAMSALALERGFRLPS